MSRQSDYNDPPIKPSSTTTTTHPSSDNNSTTSHQSDNHPIKQPPSKTHSFPVREDCWSEDATFTLIEAWGDRFLQLNRGNLRQKHWQEVADAVNARHGHVKKARRTDVQCKNRMDTLKKKYKVEKSKALESGSNNYVSSWPFFQPLDSLIGSIFKPLNKTPTPPFKRKRAPATPSPSFPALPPPPSSVPVGRRSKRPAPPLYQPSTDSSFFRRNFSLMAAAAAAIDGGGGDSDGDDDSETSWSSGGNGNANWSGRRRRSENRNPRRMVRVEKEEEEEMDGDPYEKLAEAIGRFAGVYARVEEAKQRQMVELEKQRMQFTKDLELQRMKLLMESQMQLEKLKRLKTNSEADFHRIDEEDHSTSVN